MTTIRTPWIMMLSPQNCTWYFGTDLTKVIIKKIIARITKAQGWKSYRMRGIKYWGYILQLSSWHFELLKLAFHFFFRKTSEMSSFHNLSLCRYRGWRYKWNVGHRSGHFHDNETPSKLWRGLWLLKTGEWN